MDDELKKKLYRIIDKFNDMSILVIGDVMLDKYVWGDVSRISPEAPIPIVHVKKETSVPGGAANCALNFSKLGATVHLCGIVGDDDARKELLESLRKEFIDTDGLFMTQSHTIVKQRVVTKKQHLLRMDYEQNILVDDKTVDKMLDYVRSLISHMDAIVISDYAKSLNSKRLMTEIISLANKNNVKTIVDTKAPNYEIYKHATIVTPNHTDAINMAGAKKTDDILSVGKRLADELATTLVMTRGKDGMSIFFSDGKTPIHIPSKAKKVYDISGAGDTVACVLALSVACGSDVNSAAIIASYAAATVISKVGTATTSIDEIKRFIDDDNSR